VGVSQGVRFSDFTEASYDVTFPYTSAVQLRSNHPGKIKASRRPEFVFHPKNRQQAELSRSPESPTCSRMRFPAPPRRLALSRPRHACLVAALRATSPTWGEGGAGARAAWPQPSRACGMHISSLPFHGKRGLSQGGGLDADGNQHCERAHGHFWLLPRRRQAKRRRHNEAPDHVWLAAAAPVLPSSWAKASPCWFPLVERARPRGGVGRASGEKQRGRGRGCRRWHLAAPMAHARSVGSESSASSASSPRTLARQWHTLATLAPNPPHHPRARRARS